MRILVVEDEERSRKGLVRLIQSIDPAFKIVGQAEDGKEGLRLIDSLRPDVVFTDIRMPVMDGLSMIEAVVDGGRYQCRFVVVSAYSDFEYARKALRFNVCDYILKPVTYEEVERTLFSLANNLPSTPYSEGCTEELYPVPDAVNPLVRAAVKQIRQGYAGPMSLDEVATKLNVTSEYLSQLFSKQMGIAFTSYLKSYRVDVAKRLLLEKRWSIQDVAAMAGYQNAKYFCRVFREITDLSPSEFVKQHSNLPEIR